jgi:hypothetical protein
MRSSRVSMLARAGSAIAAAGLATAGVLMPATAAGAATNHVHKAPTHLWIRHRAVPKTGHKSDVILGLLRTRGHARHAHGLAGATVILESRVAHAKWAVVSSAPTGKHGVVSFTVTPTARTAYVLVFKGDATHRRTHSAVIVLRAPKA